MKTIKQSFPSRSKVLIKASLEKTLKVNIKQVLIDGEAVYCWDKQKQAIKDLDSDLYDLVRLCGESLEGNNSHFTYNAKYFAKQCLNSLGKTIYTFEDHREQLQQLKDGVHNHKIFDRLFTLFGGWAVGHIKEYLAESGDLFKYKDFSKSFDHWNEQFSKRDRSFSSFGRDKPLGKKTGNTPQEALKSFFSKLDEYRSLQKQYQFKTLPSKSDLWDCSRLAEYLSCDIGNIYKVMCSSSEEVFNTELEKLISVCVKTRQNRLRELIEKYGLM